jgi:hypothetical protein
MAAPRLRATIERISALPRLDLGKGFDDPPAVRLGEPPDGFILGLKPQPGRALLSGC